MLEVGKHVWNEEGHKCIKALEAWKGREFKEPDHTTPVWDKTVKSIFVSDLNEAFLYPCSKEYNGEGGDTNKHCCIVRAFFDLVAFKAFDDRFNYEFGSQMIRMFAQVARSVIDKEHEAIFGSVYKKAKDDYDGTPLELPDSIAELRRLCLFHMHDGDEFTIMLIYPYCCRLNLHESLKDGSELYRLAQKAMTELCKRIYDEWKDTVFKVKYTPSKSNDSESDFHVSIKGPEDYDSEHFYLTGCRVRFGVSSESSETVGFDREAMKKSAETMSKQDFSDDYPMFKGEERGPFITGSKIILRDSNCIDRSCKDFEMRDALVLIMPDAASNGSILLSFMRECIRRIIDDNDLVFSEDADSLVSQLAIDNHSLLLWDIQATKIECNYSSFDDCSDLGDDLALMQQRLNKIATLSSIIKYTSYIRTLLSEGIRASTDTIWSAFGGKLDKESLVYFDDTHPCKSARTLR